VFNGGINHDSWPGTVHTSPFSFDHFLMLALQLAESRPSTHINTPSMYYSGSPSKVTSSRLESPFAFTPLVPPPPTYSSHSYISPYTDVSPPFSSNTHHVHPRTPYAEPQLSPMTTFFGLPDRTSETEREEEMTLKKRKMKKSGVLDSISSAHQSPFSLLLDILDPTNPEFADRHNIIYGNKSTRVGDLLDTICMDSRGLQHIHSWISRSPRALSAFTDAIHDEMDYLSASSPVSTNKDITPEFLRNWTMPSYRESAPLISSILLAAAESPLQQQRNNVKNPQVVSVFLSTTLL
jgi:hypothetical protein